MKVPLRYNFARDVIDKTALKNPTKTALLHVPPAFSKTKTKRVLTWDDIRRQSNSIAHTLKQRGLSRGARVAIGVGRSPEWWISMVGVNRAGMVAVPGTSLLTAKDLIFRFNSAKVEAVICDDIQAEKVEDLIDAESVTLTNPLLACVTATPHPNRPAKDGWISYEESFLAFDKASESEVIKASETLTADTAWDEPALLFFTSGTTGAPKKVVHSHSSYGLAHRVTASEWLDLTDRDLHWNLSDTGWAKAAWSSLFAPWLAGSTVFVQQASPKFDAKETLHTLQEHPITTFCAPPTVFRSLVAHPDLASFKSSTLRHVVSAGEPLNPEVIAEWKEATGLTIHDGYGQTETTLLIANRPGQAIKQGAMGKPVSGFDIQIIDNELKPVEDGIEGDLAIKVKPERPLGLFLGYESNDKENKEKFRGDWYLTGDRAYRDSDGVFWFVGRADDVILSSGYRIGPFEVESALLEHHAILESAVVASPDPQCYEIVKAFIVLREGFKPSAELVADIQKKVKSVTAPYKYPRAIEFVDSLPKTISGKIRRTELRAMEREKKLAEQKLAELKK